MSVKRMFLSKLNLFIIAGHTIVAHSSRAYLWGGRNDEVSIFFRLITLV